MNVEVVVDDEIRLADGFSTVAISVAEIGVREVLDTNMGEWLAGAETANPLAGDLLLIAAIVYVTDKAIPRRVAEDAWTRELSVVFPVSDPAAWEPAKGYLEECLSFLTGDEWAVSFAQRAVPLFTRPAQDGPAASHNGLHGVSLFSGGADSLVGVLDHLAEAPSDRLILVGHHDATSPAGDQARLWHLLESARYGGRTELQRFRIRPLPARWSQPGHGVSPARAGREATLRARSFVFLALGLSITETLGDEIPLLVPENGFIAINIPLTPSRVGSCSTRTTHPYFLEIVRALAHTIGIRSTLVNPLEEKTKGEVLAQCRDQETLAQLGPESVSCAHPSRRNIWARRQARNCGYCVPCLIRRAAFHHVGQDRGDAYGLDVLSGELPIGAAVAADARAVLDCLDQVRSGADVESRVLMTGPLGTRLGSSIGLVKRGLDELRGLVTDKGHPELRRWADYEDRCALPHRRVRESSRRCSTR
jgi:7-cyano-7-deazaguanine synthase in queuosine biosynthesis